MSGDELREVKHYLVIDLEATTDDGGNDKRAVPRDEMGAQTEGGERA